MVTDRYLERVFVDCYFLAHGNLEKASKLAGITGRQGYELTTRPRVKELLAARRAELMASLVVTAQEVIGTLVSQMRGDIADIFPDEPVLQAAKQAGISRLIKKVKIKETAEGRHIELEMYSSQEATKTLAKIMGLDGQEDLQRAREAIKLYCEIKGCSAEEAIAALGPHLPAVLKVKNEFVNYPPLPGEGIVITIEGADVSNQHREATSLMPEGERE